MIHKVHIAEPCSRNWESMTRIEQGRFCGSCQKKVYDLRGESLQGLALIFEHQKGQLCGRIDERQLLAYNNWVDKQNIFAPLSTLRSAVSAWSMLAFSLCIAPFKKSIAAETPTYLDDKFSERKKVMDNALRPSQDSARVLVINVRDENNEAIGGTTVEVFDNMGICKGGISTNLEGNASIHTKLDNGFLKISYLGFKSQKINFKSGDSNFKIILKEDVDSLIGEIIILNRKPLWKRVLFFPYYQSKKLWRKIRNN